MSKGSLITLVALIALVVGGLFVWKSVQRAKAEAEAPSVPHQTLSATKMYRENKAYVDQLLKEAHAPAFAQAYKSGSLFAPSEWDEQRYLELVFDYIEARALKDNKPDVAQGLPAVARMSDRNE